MTMRPEKIENIPLIRTLNNISMKIVDSVTPYAPIYASLFCTWYIGVSLMAYTCDVSYRIDRGFSEDRAIEELVLSDLRGDAEVEHVILNIQDQRRLFFNQEDKKCEDISRAKDPAKILRRLRNTLGAQGAVDLAAAAGAANKGIRGEGDNGGAPNCRGDLGNAMVQITQAINDRKSLLYDTNTPIGGSVSPPMGGEPALELDDIPRSIQDALALTHATTTEFLHHFWLAFLSGDEKRAGDLQALVGSLRRSSERVEAVAKQAEEEREKEKERRKQTALAEYKATGRKRRKGADDNIPGGRKLVEDVLGPTMRAVVYAVQKWEDAVRESEKAQGISTSIGAGGVGAAG